MNLFKHLNTNLNESSKKLSLLSLNSNISQNTLPEVKEHNNENHIENENLDDDDNDDNNNKSSEHQEDDNPDKKISGFK